jgi:hypothetical protein
MDALGAFSVHYEGLPLSTSCRTPCNLKHFLDMLDEFITEDLESACEVE